MRSMFELAPHVSWKELDGLIVAVDTKSGSYYSLNDTASAIWKEVVNGKSKSAVIEHLMTVFQVDEDTLAADVDRSTEKWLAEGLIRPSS